MSEIVFLLEEQSAEALLRGLIPRILPAAVTFRCFAFEGKQDLEKQMVRRIRGYRVPGARFFILRDQDMGDCRAIKSSLWTTCSEAGRSDSIVRIACRELESWYLADLLAVEKALGVKGLARRQKQMRFREPDGIVMPSELLRRLVPSYQHISGSRLIGPELDLENKRSTSFAHFIEALRRLARELTTNGTKGTKKGETKRRSG